MIAFTDFGNYLLFPRNLQTKPKGLVSHSYILLSVYYRILSGNPTVLVTALYKYDTRAG